MKTTKTMVSANGGGKTNTGDNGPNQSQIRQTRDIVEQIAGLAIEVQGLAREGMLESSESRLKAARLCVSIERLTGQLGWMADKCCGLLDGTGMPEVKGDAADWMLGARRDDKTFEEEEDQAA